MHSIVFDFYISIYCNWCRHNRIILIITWANRGLKIRQTFRNAFNKTIKNHTNPLLLLLLADKAYDSELIRKNVLNRRSGSIRPDTIKKKRGCKNRTLKTKLVPQSFGTIYMHKMNIESVIYVMKRRFSGENYSKSTTLQNKERKLKNVLYNIYRAIQIL